jgi:acyl-[acyl-carrier-protein]-phospholipid O-acyltransferase / long-chain-fatty-acid--[acyl-carrier-protein] ligase
MTDLHPSASSSYTAPKASITGLMTTRRFAPMFFVQFLAALSDNILKNGLSFLVLASLAKEQSGTVIGVAGALFMLPFFLLAALGGDLADCHNKAEVVRKLKFAEIFVALLAAGGLYFHSLPTLFAALLGFGIISALFGPTKYGILPDHLDRSDLPLANALIEGSTFIAILAGTGLAALSGTHDGLLAAIIIVAALSCYGVSRIIPPTAKASERAVDFNILRGTFVALKDFYQHKRLWNYGLATTAFWAVGALVMTLLPGIVIETFGGSNALVSMHLVIFAVTLAIGSLAGAMLSGGRIVLLPAVLGAGIAGLALADLSLVIAFAKSGRENLTILAYFSQPSAFHAAVDFALMALGGGLLAVPTFAALQAEAPDFERSRIVAACGILNAGGMVVVAGVIAILSAIHMPIAGTLALAALGMIGVAIWMRKALDIGFTRDFFAMIFRVFYGIEIRGLENLDPAVAGENPIIAVNHISFLDAAIIFSLLPRQPVFAVDKSIAKAWWLKPFIKPMRAMPLDPASPLATRTLIAAVKAGNPLVIFPEGRLTVTGTLMKIYDGTALVTDKTGANVVPIRIEGPERTPFSKLSAREVPRKLFPKIRVTVLPPTKVTVDAHLFGKLRRQAAGRALYMIMSNLMYRTSLPEGTLFEAVTAAGKLHGMKQTAVEDPVFGQVSYDRLLTGARLLGQKILKAPVQPIYDKVGSSLNPLTETIGIMLPTSAAAAIALLGVQSAGRTAAMINFTAGLDGIRSACKAANIRTIITSKTFIDKAKLTGVFEALQSDITFVMMEELRQASLLTKLKAKFACTKPLKRAEPDQPAVILFTSGSEGTPKGVALSHKNLLANVTQVAARIDFNRADKVFNVLPIFHAFGLTGGLILPLVHGVPTYLYPTPLHYRIIPELIYSSCATVLFGTDTFLLGYAKTANPYDFRSLRYVVAGAAPVGERTRAVYAEKFGLRILEGYGLTETAPVLALNTPMYNKAGTVGRFVPDIEYRLEAVEGLAGGHLFVRGPNVMMGYLKVDQPGVLQRLADGWFDSGDIVAIDDIGYVTIIDRVKRIANIGGEKISLRRVEELVDSVWPNAQSGCVALPDPRKGEKIVCLTTEETVSKAALSAAANAQGLPEIAVPSEVYSVKALPLLGTGKPDFGKLKALALEIAEKQKPVREMEAV